MLNLKQVNTSKFQYQLEDLKIHSQDRICICCLSPDNKLIKLANCKHSDLIEDILKLKFDTSSAMVCCICHAVMKKFEDFKIFVQKSITKLNNELEKVCSESTYGYSNIELNSAIDSKPFEFESKPYPELGKIEFETEVKMENDSYSDIEQEPVVLKKNKIKVTRTSLEKKYEGKIRLITLTNLEMMTERKEEALKKNYLNLPFKCEKCITGFDHELTLTDHIEKRHSKKKGCFTCHICKSVLSTKTSFDEHHKRHFKRYQCVECLKRYSNVHSVLKHYNEHHGKIDTHFSCKMCEYTTESYRCYRYHLDKHRSAKVECAECGSSFVNKTGLRMHMFTIHGQSSRVYACEQCGKRYRAKSGLAAHLASHATTPPAFCAPCHKHFRTELGLRHHLKTHSKHVTDSDKRFTCEECGVKFLSKRSLQEHADWVHLNNTKHACNKCTKVFKNRSSLKKHKEFVHEKKRPPRNKICDYCGRGFTTLSILQAHIRTHTGERPLMCTHCPATFAHSAALYTHNKLLHAR